MGRVKSRANGDGDVFPRKNRAGKITSYRGAYFGPDGKRRYVSGKTKEEARRSHRRAKGDAERGLVFDADTLDHSHHSRHVFPRAAEHAGPGRGSHGRSPIVAYCCRIAAKAPEFESGGFLPSLGKMLFSR